MLAKEPPRIPADPSAGKILITGTGRAGTTVLVRILTELGLDTGFDRSSLSRVERRVGRAGLETKLTRANVASAPLVIKAPGLVDTLPPLLEQGLIAVDVAIVPMRDLGHAAESRARTSQRFAALGRDGAAPGGLWKTDDPESQPAVLAVQLHRLMELMARYEIRTIFPYFPRFVTDFDHFDRTVGDYLRKRFGIPTEELRRAHGLHCKPDLVTVR